MQIAKPNLWKACLFASKLVICQSTYELALNAIFQFRFDYFSVFLYEMSVKETNGDYSSMVVVNNVWIGVNETVSMATKNSDFQHANLIWFLA